MRDLGTTGEALLNRMLAGEEVPVVQLVRLSLQQTIYLTTAGHDVDYDGHTWIGNSIASIEPISDGVGELESLRFVRPLVSEEHIAMVLSAPFAGKLVTVYDAWLDPGTRQVAHVEVAWRGVLNMPDLQDGQTAIASCTADHIGVRSTVTKASRYTNDEQQRIYPGDTSLDVDPKVDGGQIAWPKASYFKK